MREGGDRGTNSVFWATGAGLRIFGSEDLSLACRHCENNSDMRTLSTPLLRSRMPKTFPSRRNTNRPNPSRELTSRD